MSEGVCPCTVPNPLIRFAEPCRCTDAERLARAMDLLFDLTRAAGEHAAMEWRRDWNSAYSAAENFLTANGRPTSEYSPRLE